MNRGYESEEEVPETKGVGPAMSAVIFVLVVGGGIGVCVLIALVPSIFS